MEKHDPNTPLTIDVDDVLSALGPPLKCAHCGGDVRTGEACENCGSSETVAAKVAPPRIPIWVWVISVLFPPLLLGLLVYRFVLYPRLAAR